MLGENFLIFLLFCRLIVSCYLKLVSNFFAKIGLLFVVAAKVDLAKKFVVTVSYFRLA